MSSPSTFVLTYDDTPKSLNAGGVGSRQHWSKGHAEKKKWEGVYAMLLLYRKVPRGMQHARCDVLLEFRYRNRRDVENYRASVTKPLADALVNGGWLPDDTNAFFEVGDFQLMSGVELPGRIKGRTTVSIEATYPVPA